MYYEKRAIYKYKLLSYTDSDHDSYIHCQLDAFTKYIIEFFGACDITIMESHLQILKPYLFKIIVENEIAGYVYFKEESTQITVDVFTLLPNYRNKGLGTIIMQDFIKTADKINKLIVVDTFKTNPAKKFYERNGFQVVDENSSHYILKYFPKI